MGLLDDVVFPRVCFWLDVLTYKRTCVYHTDGRAKISQDDKSTVTVCSVTVCGKKLFN